MILHDGSGTSQQAMPPNVDVDHILLCLQLSLLCCNTCIGLHCTILYPA